MTTSANITWELDRDDLIERAFAKLGLPGEGNTLSTQQYTDGSTNLNAAIAHAVTDGMALWKRTEVSLTPTITAQSFTITGAVKVAQVYLKDTTSGTRYDLDMKSKYDLNKLPYGTTGIPVSCSFTPTISGGTLDVWPTYSDTNTVANKTINVVLQRKFDGFFASTDTLDMPSYWILPIVYKLAVLLAPEQGVPLNDRQSLKEELKVYWEAAKGYGDEDGSIFIQPARSR